MVSGIESFDFIDFQRMRKRHHGATIPQIYTPPGNTRHLELISDPDIALQSAALKINTGHGRLSKNLFSLYINTNDMLRRLSLGS